MNTMYVLPTCPYCVKAKNLLNLKGVQYDVIDISSDNALAKEMIERSGGRKTVPQIFIGSYHVGGSDDLEELVNSGNFDEILKNNT